MAHGCKVQDTIAENARCDIVHDDTCSSGNPGFEKADGKGLEDIEDTKQDEPCKNDADGKGMPEQGDHHACDFIDDDEARIFTSGNHSCPIGSPYGNNADDQQQQPSGTRRKER